MAHRTTPRTATPVDRRAVMLSAAAAIVAPSACRAATSTDARLVALARELRITLADALRALVPIPDDERNAHNARLEVGDTILDRMAELDAFGGHGLAAKADAFDFASGFDLQNGWDLGHSLALDVLRMFGGAA